MFGWLFQRTRIVRKARNKRHCPPPSSFIPRLEELEPRVLLNANNPVESAAAGLLNDMAQVRSDVENVNVWLRCCGR